MELPVTCLKWISNNLLDRGTCRTTSSTVILGTVVKRIKLYNELIANAI